MRSETIPSSRITPDLQIHSFSSSVHLTHLLQGSDQRTPDTRSETIPSSRITPDLQIHSFFSSVHSLIFYRVQVRDHLTRDQRPFLHPESLQIFRFTASPLQFTHLLQGSGQRTGMASRSLVLCSVTHSCVVFEVCVWIIVRLKIQIWTIIRFLTESVT